MKDKIVYVNRGSEDGNLGVFTNMKLAYEAAKAAYFPDEGVNKTYAKFCKEIKANMVVVLGEKGLEDYDGSYIEVEAFYLNDFNK